MGSWNGTTVGLKVKPKEKKLAEQFLTCLGVDTDDYGIEEVGPLSAAFGPSIEGVLNGNLLGIASTLTHHYSDYINQFYFFGGEDDFEDEEWEEDEEDEHSPDDDDAFDFLLDDLFQLANKLFSSAHLYLAHEEGNNTSDDYYRYEVILDPTSNKRIELNCFYSYGEGINTDGDDPKEDGTERNEEPIVSREINPEVIDWLIQQAESKGFSELVARLHTCK